MKTFAYFLLIIVIILALFQIGEIAQQKQITPTQNKPILKTQTHTQIPSQTNTKVTISSGKIPSIPLSLAAGFAIHNFASGLGAPRDLQFSPGGTLLVSDPSNNRVFALPDANKDGVADSEKVIISGENHVHGLAFYDGKLFLADVNRVVRYNWDENSLRATLDKVLFSLPENSDHNARTLTFDQTGKMYATVGSTCDVCYEKSPLSGTVTISNANGDNPRIFAKGLRNAPFLAFNPATKELWGTEMGRDYLGNTTPPDEINIIRNRNDYGWPRCYGNKVHDTDFDQTSIDPCGNTTSPVFEIPAHSAPLGLAFVTSSQFPNNWQNDLLVAYHGSWNKSTPIGYKVVHLKVDGNKITSSEDFLTGFAPVSTPNTPGNSTNSAKGRPVDLTFDASGNLYISDDKAGTIYIVQRIKF